MKKEIQRLTFLVGLIAMSSCSKTSFTDVSPVTAAKAEIPVDPTPVVPPPTPVIPPAPTYSSKLSNGICNPDSSTSVLSCLKCDVPLKPPAPPQLSAKAQALVDGMFLACQISNASDRNSFRPTKEMILNKLNRGSDLLYPDTAKTSQMAMVVEGLTNPQDDSVRQKLFGGLWYKPPYTDAFETYFGLTVQEAKSTFCWDGNVQTPKITNVTGVYSKQWADCQSGFNPGSCQEIPAYVTAQSYRTQFENVLTTSITNPYVAPPPGPDKVCSWDKFVGDDIPAAITQFKLWKSQGRKLSVEIKKAGGVGLCGESSEANFVVGMTVSIASYICK